MVLIEVRKADGTLMGRCDASCYEAVGGVCLCICGGANHGVGLRRALENVAETFVNVMEEAKQIRSWDTGVMVQVSLPLQLGCRVDSG